MKAQLRILATTLVATALTVMSAQPSLARSTWDTSPVQVTRQVSPTPQTVNLRVGQHATYDRVVIDFHGSIPGYHVSYVKALHYDPSGENVPLRGARFIAIVLTPATAHDAQGRSVYVGPTLVRYSMPSLRGAAFTGDNEGYVSFGLALSHLADFRVLEVHQPDRLVIDVHH